MREKPIHLKWLKTTDKRDGLTREQGFMLRNFCKGHLGEVDIDKIMNRFEKKEWIHFKDLNLDYNGAKTQIDPPVVIENLIYEPLGHDQQYTSQFKSGLLCSHCLSQILTFHMLHAQCTCGAVKSKHELLRETIEDYLIIYLWKDVTVADVSEFINHQISRNTIRSVMDDHLEKISYHLYKNPHKLEMIEPFYR